MNLESADRQILLLLDRVTVAVSCPFVYLSFMFYRRMNVMDPLIKKDARKQISVFTKMKIRSHKVSHVCLNKAKLLLLHRGNVWRFFFSF